MEYIISGYISVRTALEAGSRPFFSLIYDKKRYEAVMRSGFHEAEKRQYAALAKYNVKTEYVTDAEFASLCGSATAGGIAARVGERTYTPLDTLLSVKNGYIAVLDGLEDPFNFGYALRTMYAAGVDGIILPERNFFTATETVVRSSAGASELLKLSVVSDLGEAVKAAKERGYMIASTAKSDKARDLYRTRFKRPLCLVFGGEKRGISTEIISISDAIVKIKYPRNCPFSLSASSAVSIISFEVARRLEDF